MTTFNSFSELYAAQGSCCAASNIAKFFDSAPVPEHTESTDQDTAPLENAYSEQEKQQRIKMCQQQIAVALSEIDQIEAAVNKAKQRIMKANSPQRRNIQRPVPLTAKQNPEKADRKSELDIRMDALRNRIAQIRDTDPTGQFVKQCLAIEEKMKAFRAQTKQAIDYPQAQQDVRNEAENHTNHPSPEHQPPADSQYTLFDALFGRDD